MPLINSTTESLPLVYMFKYCTCKVCIVCACLTDMLISYVQSYITKTREIRPPCYWRDAVCFPSKIKLYFSNQDMQPFCRGSLITAKTATTVTQIPQETYRNENKSLLKNKVLLNEQVNDTFLVNHYMAAVTTCEFSGIFPPRLTKKGQKKSKPVWPTTICRLALYSVSKM